MTTTSISQQIFDELKRSDIPDLGFLYSSKALAHAPEVLEELLENEKKDFYIKLETPQTDLSFELLQDFSHLDYYFSLLNHYQGVHNDTQIRKIIEDFEPKYIEFGNEIAYSKVYYEHLKYIFEHTDVTDEQKRILDTAIEAYELRGIDLEETQKNRLKEISQRLAELSQIFSNNVLDSKAEFEYLINDASLISEMPEDDRAVAKQRYEEKYGSNSDNETENYLFDASPAAYESIMKYCNDSQIRKHFYDAKQQFAASGKYDNGEIIIEILQLRDEKAKILGFQNYAELSLQTKMADTPKQVITLFEDIAQKGKHKAQQEIEEIKSFSGLTELHPWDMSYYARKLKEGKYELDEKELKKYFKFETVLEGMFDIVKKLYGIEMKKISLSNSYDTNVEIYEVYDAQGTFLSYFLTDYFYNPLKRPGAWADIIREKYISPSSLEKKGDTDFSKFVINVANFQSGADGVTLLTHRDVETMFHEFGHAIHEMTSRSSHSELSGFHVEWDFVELPSQLLENWARHPDGLKTFAQYFKTGEPIPDAMLEKLQALETFGNGYFVVKQNEYAMLDMKIHSQEIPKNSLEMQKFVHTNYQETEIFPLPEVYNQHLTFGHIWGGGYSAGYYSYMWAEILEKTVWKTFKDAGDIFSPEVAEKFYNSILSAGTTKKASELFQDFMGREVQIDAFLEEKGLI